MAFADMLNTLSGIGRNVDALQNQQVYHMLSVTESTSDSGILT